jgi:hypothetical protein
MSCCGKKRESTRNGRTVSVAATNENPVFLAPRTPVVFCGTGPYLVEGPMSREVYYFSPKQAEQLIDAADAAVLLKSNLFKRKNAVEQIAALVPVSLQPSEHAVTAPASDDSASELI